MRLNAIETWYKDHFDDFRLQNYVPRPAGGHVSLSAQEDRGAYNNAEGFLPAAGVYREYWIGAGVGAPGERRLITRNGSVQKWFTYGGTHGHGWWRHWDGVHWMNWVNPAAGLGASAELAGYDPNRPAHLILTAAEVLILGQGVPPDPTAVAMMGNAFYAGPAPVARPPVAVAARYR